MGKFSVIKEKLAVDTQTSSYSDGILHSNLSLDPVPIGSPERKWTWPSILGFWIAEAFSISMYQVASSSIAAGLSPGLAICAILVGHVIISIPAMLNAYWGAQRGINFPITMRAVFGVYGAKVMVAVRGMVALIWFGTQTYQGGQVAVAAISAIWPSFKTFPNHLPANAHITSAELLGFFIFLIFQIPLLYLNINQLRYFFMFKIVLMPIFGIVLFAWAVSQAHGFGPIFRQGNNIVDGTPTAVVFFRCMISVIGPKATLALNITDFTRYAKHPNSVMWPQFVGLVVLVSLCGILGIIVTSATKVIYGVDTWNPVQVSYLWENRAAQFFSSFCWAIGIIGTNISANSVSFGNDLTLWFPKYITPRRGAFICCIISVATNPWQIQNNAASFSKFLGGYTLFLAPPAAIMIVDYFILRKQVMNLPGCYHRHGPYTFFHGFNIPAFIAFFCGIAPNLPGLAWATGNTSIPTGAVYLYSISYITGFVVAGTIYYTLCKLFPKLWMADLENVHEAEETYVIDSTGSSGSQIDVEKQNNIHFKENEL